MLSLCTCNIEDIYHYNICFIRNPIYIFYISMFRTSFSHFRTVSSHLRTVSSATRRSELCLKTVSSHFPRFSLPLEPSLGTMPLRSALSQLHTLYVAQLLLSPRIICLPTKLTHVCLFCTINNTQLCRGRIFPQLLSQVVISWDRTCHPKIREPVSYTHLTLPTIYSV